MQFQPTERAERPDSQPPTQRALNLPVHHARHRSRSRAEPVSPVRLGACGSRICDCVALLLVAGARLGACGESALGVDALDQLRLLLVQQLLHVLRTGQDGSAVERTRWLHERRHHTPSRTMKSVGMTPKLLYVLERLAAHFDPKLPGPTLRLWASRLHVPAHARGPVFVLARGRTARGRRRTKYALQG